MDDLKPILDVAAQGIPLTADQADQAFDILMSGKATDAQIGAFLMALRVRGETVTELTAGVRALRSRSTKIDAPANAIDTCGTGGDASGSYNISTAVALVVAACGVPVAKHGNRSLSSRSGSAEVLAQLGVNLEAGRATIENCLKKANIGFMFAPAHHSAMKHVAKARQELGTRTLFNLLGPMANPAGAKRQLLGVFDAKWLQPMADVLAALGSEKAWVVHGSDGLDELTTTGESQVVELSGGNTRAFTIAPEDAGLPVAKPADLRGGTPADNAAAMTRLLEGEAGPYRDIVLLNAAAALIVADKADGLPAGVTLAATALDSGKAKKSLLKLVELSNTNV